MAISPVLDTVDIAGYNYASGRYKEDGIFHPNRIIFGSETFPQELPKNWGMVLKYPYLIGISCGRSEAVWRGTNAIPSWSWSGCENYKMVVEVYTKAPFVELWMNGEKVGKKKTKDIRALFKVKYQPGKLEPIAFYQVHAIQINFADDRIEMPIPGELHGKEQPRYIEERELVTRWKLEGSMDGINYFTIEDKSNVQTDLSHDLVVREEGIEVQYIRLTCIEVPYGQNPCISGLRVFGVGKEAKPEIPKYKVIRQNELDMIVEIKNSEAVGYNILWGPTPEKLYHSYLTYENMQRIGALVKNQEYFVRVDAFNEGGITEGETVKLG